MLKSFYKHLLSSEMFNYLTFLLLGWCMASYSGSFIYICDSPGIGKKCTDGKLAENILEDLRNFNNYLHVISLKIFLRSLEGSRDIKIYSQIIVILPCYCYSSSVPSLKRRVLRKTVNYCSF